MSIQLRAGKILLSFALLSLLFSLTSCAPKDIVQPPKSPAKIALVLGAGAARGFSHIGVLKVLENNGIPVHMIVGTSAGSFVGSLSAYGFNAYQLQKMALELQKGDVIDLTIPDNGFVKGELLENYINRMLRNTPIEKLRTPFYAVTTNVSTGEEVVFTQGNAGMAVRASSAIPGVFRPVRINGRAYVDGGVVSPVAVEAARRFGADIVIAVDISSDLDIRVPVGTIDTILQSVNIMYTKIAASQLARADVIVRPKVGHIGSAEFDKRHEAILEGERAANEALPQINAIVGRLRHEGRL
ncbi:MAG TPA: patatin-like phospholipase family protein [Dissulfurispiraceae bacterium]|nr:patatin-like phospholipase family protein [Dissulfurispiraceae bacterium]